MKHHNGALDSDSEPSRRKRKLHSKDGAAGHDRSVSGFVPLNHVSASSKDLELAFGLPQGQIASVVDQLAPVQDHHTAPNLVEDASWASTLDAMDRMIKLLACVFVPSRPQVLVDAMRLRTGVVDVTLSDTPLTNHPHHPSSADSMDVDYGNTNAPDGQPPIGGAVDDFKKAESGAVTKVEPVYTVDAHGSVTDAAVKQEPGTSSGAALAPQSGASTDLVQAPETQRRLLETLVTCDARAKRLSTERKTIRAMLCGSFTRKELIHVTKDLQFSAGRSMYEDAIKDYKMLKSDGFVSLSLAQKATKKALSKSEVAKVNAVVSYLLSPSAVGHLSFGRIVIEMEDQNVDFPALCRRMSRADLYSSYRQWTSSQNLSPISKSLFAFLVDELTSDEATEVYESTDYVSRFLAVDAFETMIRIVRDHKEAMEDDDEEEEGAAPTEEDDDAGAAPSSESGDHPITGKRRNGAGEPDLEQLLKRSCNFVRFCYPAHVGSLDECSTHCIPHLLQDGYVKPREDTGPSGGEQGAGDENSNNNNADEAANTVICARCMLPFIAIEKVRKTMPKENEYVHHVLTICLEKVKLFMAHRARAKNQRLHIESGLKHIADASCAAAANSDEAWLVLQFQSSKDDFGMDKVPPATRDENTPKNATWHGVVVYYATYDPVQAESTIETLYFDDFMAGANQNDETAVYSFLEGVLLRLKKCLPGIKRVTIQTEPQSVYVSSLMMTLYLKLYAATGVQVSRIIRTEPYDMAKSAVHHHFRKCVKWIQEHVATPDWTTLSAGQFVTVLGLKDGLRNTTPSIVSRDFAKCASLLDEVMLLAMKLDDTNTFAASDIVIQYHTPVHQLDSPGDAAGQLCFEINCASYSGIESSQWRIRISMGANPGEEPVVEIIANEEHPVGVTYEECIPEKAADTVPRIHQQIESTRNSEQHQRGDELNHLDDDIVVDFEKDQSVYSFAGSSSGMKLVSKAGLHAIQKTWTKPLVWRRGSKDDDNNDAAVRQQYLSFAVQRTIEMSNSGEMDIYDASDETRDESLWSFCEKEVLAEIPTQCHSGWAMRDHWAKTQVLEQVCSVETHREQILRFYEPYRQKERVPYSKVWKQLVNMYPGNYLLPSKFHVRQEIDRVHVAPKPAAQTAAKGDGDDGTRTVGYNMNTPVKAEANQVRGEKPPEPSALTASTPRAPIIARVATSSAKRGRKGMSSYYEAGLMNMVSEFPEIKPKEGLRIFKTMFSKSGGEDDFPSDRQIKTKISNIKQMIRTNRMSVSATRQLPPSASKPSGSAAAPKAAAAPEARADDEEEVDSHDDDDDDDGYNPNLDIFTDT